LNSEPNPEPWNPGTRNRSLFRPLDIPEVVGDTPLGNTEERVMTGKKSDILQGTLDLMVLKTLDAMGPMHGYGIALRIEQLSEDALRINQGTIYLCLIRLVQKGWIKAQWGASENNRKAKFYDISKAGRKQLQAETENWERVSGVIGRLLQLARRSG
jgi:PadR family transcriptional regulator